MGRSSTRNPMSRRVLSPIHNHNTENHPHDQPVVQLSSSIFGFLEEEAVMLSSLENGNIVLVQNIEDEDEGDSETPEYIKDKITFWENQRKILHTTLFRTTNLEAKIRNITKEVLDELEMAENVCSCFGPVYGGCRNCKMNAICNRLQNSGYNSAICKSKWKSTYDIPSGEHTFVDVIDVSSLKKGEIRVIIEIDFRSQFEMKKGSDEYNSIVYKLPNVFVGKFDRLQNVIKILSNSAKKCMKEKKMHLGPWRKQGYMQAKWLRVKERTTIITTTLNEPLAIDDGCSSRMTKTGASMLTMDLLDSFQNMSYICSHAVKVL